ncbi:MAG: uracil-DNA glycosylase [Planctomycetaceae bacterium]|jgi:DNA polymerase|nr:uracil-DNA glycosylase [Planctomycetaceae bacterium]
MYQGVSDYLAIMQLSGLSELPRAERVVKKKITAAAAAGIIAAEPEPAAEPAFVSDPVSVIPPPSVSVTPPVSADKRLQLLAAEVAQCRKCSELAAARCQTVFGTGNPAAELVFIGEAPGADEDKQGEPFVGRAGQLLTDIIVKGMNLRREDVYICNILRCRPPGNRNPLPEEAAACRPFLDATLDIIKPKFICCLGAVAAQNLLQSEQTIGRMRGNVLNYQDIKVVCTYHPAYLLRNPAAKKDTWNDIQLLMREMRLLD